MSVVRKLLPRWSAQPLPRPSPLAVRPSACLHSTPARAFRTTRHNRNDIEAPEHLNDAERAVFTKLKDALAPSRLEVQDISGGCGSMYGLDIVSERFAGLSVIKQHKLVNQVLAEEIKSWHGVQLKTKAA